MNPCLIFERGDTMGYRLNIVAGTAVRFEPGQQRTVELVYYGKEGDLRVSRFDKRAIEG